jgi:hypothetical protein
MSLTHGAAGATATRPVGEADRTTYPSGCDGDARKPCEIGREHACGKLATEGQRGADTLGGAPSSRMQRRQSAHERAQGRAFAGDGRCQGRTGSGAGVLRRFPHVVPGGPGDRAGEEGRARHQEVVGRDDGRCWCKANGSDRAAATRSARVRVLGETRDVHWTPLRTGDMSLLPTWTPHDECGERMSRPLEGDQKWRRDRDRHGECSGGRAPGDPWWFEATVCTLSTRMSPPASTSAAVT